MGVNCTPKRKIRVLQLIDTFDVGGAEKIVLSLATTIRNDRFEVIPCALFGSGPLEEEMKAAGIAYRIIGLRRRSVLTGPFFIADLSRIVITLRRILKELSIDILHTHLTYSTLVGFLATRQRERPLFCATVHSIIFDNQRARLSPRAWFMYGGIRTTFSRADRIIAVSTKVAEAIQAYAPVPKELIKVIPNGVNGELFHSNEDRIQLRQRLKLPADRPVVISVGRLSREKGYPHLLSALASIPSAVRPVALIVGDGPDRADLESKIEKLKLERDVRLLGYRPDVPQLLAAADLFVLASHFEGLPLALLEAMAAGLPSVVTAVGETPNVIEDGKSGVLVQPADEPALAEAVRWLLREPFQRKRMGWAARERFESRFSLCRCTQTHELLYQNMLGNNQTLVLKKQI
jgi:glycosyltransferase involved in cell wall biosynthesis